MHSARLYPVDSIEIGVRYRSQNELAKEKKFMSTIALIASFLIIGAVTIVILARMHLHHSYRLEIKYSNDLRIDELGMYLGDVRQNPVN